MLEINFVMKQTNITISISSTNITTISGHLSPFYSLGVIIIVILLIIQRIKEFIHIKLELG